MEFLFHTIIYFDEVGVYYNVHQDKDYYFMEVLQNPQNVLKAKSFNLYLGGESWASSEPMEEKQIQALVEEIRRTIIF